jgi:acyl carrier protein
VRDIADDIYAGLAEVFEEVFPDSDAAVGPDTAPDDVVGWDSLGQVGLIVAVEDRFGVRFEDEEYAAFDSAGALADIIRAKLS